MKKYRSPAYPHIVLIFTLFALSNLIDTSYAQQGICIGERPDCQSAYAQEVRDKGILARCTQPCFLDNSQGLQCITPARLSCSNIASPHICNKLGCKWVECTTNRQCSSGKICDKNHNLCIRYPPQIATKPCRFNSECQSNECIGGQCGCYPQKVSCPSGTRCRSDRICVPANAPDGTPCTRDGQCANACIDNICQQRRKWGLPCQNNADCLSRACQGGICLCNQHWQCPDPRWACSSPLEGIPNGNWHCYFQGWPIW